MKALFDSILVRVISNLRYVALFSSSEAKNIRIRRRTFRVNKMKRKEIAVE